MRKILQLLPLLALAACTTGHPDRVDPGKRYPDAKTGNMTHEKTEYGILVVAPPASTESGPTGYGIYTADGRMVAEMPDRDDLVVPPQGPTEIALPAGRYLVQLDRENGKAKVFWVTIEPKRRTEVDPARLDAVEEPTVR